MSSSLVPAAVHEAEAASGHARGPHPPITPILPTSSKRLHQAAEAASIDAGGPAARTVLYLAYGSNMATAAFVGKRGIRPLSKVNVSVPSLRLTLDLRGMPYWEPRFANVGFRGRLEDKVPDTRHRGEEWDGRLMGVVYEVTLKDFGTIMRTEGAGSSYREITVSCIPIKTGSESQDNERSFLAKTLYAPQPLSQDEGGRRSWRSRLVDITPSDDHAQPSARYLKLLMDGAREHGLPKSYRRYLESLQPYTITHWRQRVGQWLLLLTWAPMLLVLFKLSVFLVDGTGRLPAGLAAAMKTWFDLMWMTYKAVFQPLFGDGERTEAADGDDGRRGEDRAFLVPIGKGG